MKADKVILPGITGTSLMTAFSYAVSAYKERNFKEPELLAALLKEGLQNDRAALAAGWMTHYTMGICWALLFELLFKKAAVKANFTNALVLGTMSGLTGIWIWRFAFKIHRTPPRIDFNQFYWHLLLAHVVYSLGVTAASKDK